MASDDVVSETRGVSDACSASETVRMCSVCFEVDPMTEVPVECAVCSEVTAVNGVALVSAVVV